MPVKPCSELRNTRVRVALPAALFRGSHLHDLSRVTAYSVFCKARFGAQLISSTRHVETPNNDYRTSGVFHPFAPTLIASVARVILRSFQSSDARFHDRVIEGFIHGPRSRRD